MYRHFVGFDWRLLILSFSAVDRLVDDGVVLRRREFGVLAFREVVVLVRYGSQPVVVERVGLRSDRKRRRTRSDLRSNTVVSTASRISCPNSLITRLRRY